MRYSEAQPYIHYTYYNTPGFALEDVYTYVHIGLPYMNYMYRLIRCV